MQLSGFHHLTAVTADISANHRFFTKTLGMRLVKKSVNQDDVSAYHLFYADGQGTPGTDVTFFDWPVPRERRGTRSIVRTGLRVAGVDSLKYWSARLGELNFKHGDIIERDGRAVLDFEDGEGQRLSLVADDGQIEPHPWQKSPVPTEHQIRGLGSIAISVSDLTPTDRVLRELMNMRSIRRYTDKSSDGGSSNSEVHVYTMGPGGPAAELHVAVEPHLAMTRAGAGGVHHVAFRVPTLAEYDQWNQRLREFGMHSSGPVDRFYFHSVYFREPSGILFELATDEPGFHADEPMETMGEKLALPPFLESRRTQIEAGLKPLATTV